MEAAKLIIQVMAGVVPENPMPEYTRTWGWTSKDQEQLQAGNHGAKQKWICIHGESREYQASLERPDLVNWVRRDWLWL